MTVKMVVGCYVRVSTENQIENYSIEEQIQRLQAYCLSKDYAIYDMYVDGGYSGGNTNRPALLKLINDAQQKKIQAVVVYKLDRLSRSQKDTLTLIEDKFLKNDVDFISVSENFDTSTPFGKAMISILSVFAQLEQDQITERFTMGRIGRSKAGYYHGGSTSPTGYDYINGDLIINPYKAEQVKQVYRMFLDGKSINAITREMHQKYGGWNSHSLTINVLRNSVYIGKVKFNGVEYNGVHKPIISKSDFENVQRLLNSKEREDSKTAPQKTPFKAGYMLTGLLRCGNCGARYSANHGYYKCYSRAKTCSRFITDPNCKNENWKIEDLDNLILDQIIALKYSPHKIDLIVENKSDVSAVSDSDMMIKRIQEIDSQMNRIMDLYQIGSLPIENISDRIKKLQNEKDALQNNLEADRIEQQSSESIERFRQLVAGIEDVLNEPVEKKRLYIGEIVRSITINWQNVSIDWRI